MVTLVIYLEHTPPVLEPGATAPNKLTMAIFRLKESFPSCNRAPMIRKRYSYIICGENTIF